MRYTVTKQLIHVLGMLWMPGVPGAMTHTLTSYDMANLGDPTSRDDVEQWLAMHSGDLQSVTDFSADFDVKRCERCGSFDTSDAVTRKAVRLCKHGHDWRPVHVVHEWASEENSLVFGDVMFGNAMHTSEDE